MINVYQFYRTNFVCDNTVQFYDTSDAECLNRLVITPVIFYILLYFFLIYWLNNFNFPTTFPYLQYD